jgi:excisionase family DNA binding protein
MSVTLLLTAEEAAAQLRIARSRIFELIQDGTIRSVKIGASRRIPYTALTEYVAKLEAAAESASA